MNLRKLSLFAFLLIFQFSFVQQLVKDINTKLVGSSREYLTPTEEYLYFVADSEEKGRVLFRMNKATEEVERVEEVPNKI